jgi:Sel1 repeat protein
LALCFYNGIGTNASPKDAFSWILKSVNTNPTPKAQNNLGVCYAVGIGAHPSNAQALEFFQKAAEAGDVTAQYNLGNMLLQEGQLDVKKGFDYLEKAAAANHLLALKKLGDLYFNGKYTNQSFERAFEYYTKASKQTPTPQKEMLDYFYQGQEEAYADVLYNLSQCYAEGKGVKKSMREAGKWAVKSARFSNKYAFDWLNKIVEKNDPKESPEVILAVADGYFYAKGTSKQNDKAFPLYEKLAKQQDNTTAQKRLMEYYFEVKNPDKNDEKAVYWAERVAKKGDASTQFSLGKYYMTMVPDVKPQPATPAPKPTPKQTPKKPAATDTPTVAVTSSHNIEPNSPEAEARAELLRRQRGGKNVTPAKQQYAVRASTRPAVAQNAPKTPMKHLNETKGIHWLAKAAEQNNVEALNELGSYYFEKQNFGQALANFQKSAQRDYAQGQYNLANCYYNGNGIDRSYEKAANYYKLSARKDYAPAQFRLGHCYYHGEGIEQSDSRAADWFEQACDNGEKKACDMLKVVTAKK